MGPDLASYLKKDAGLPLVGLGSSSVSFDNTWPFSFFGELVRKPLNIRSKSSGVASFEWSSSY